MAIIQYGQSIISSFIKKKKTMVCQSVNYCAILDLPLMIVRGLVGKVQIWGTMIFREQEGLLCMKTDMIRTAVTETKGERNRACIVEAKLKFKDKYNFI